MKLSKNFTLEEMVNSSTAKRKGIDNTPNDAVKENLKNLCTKILQPIRNKYGKPITVSSGYRCEALNKAVGGATNSDHKFGAAADIHTPSDTLADNMKLWKIIKEMVDNKEIQCRQLIFEYGNKIKGPDWIHVSINHSANGKKNNQILYLGCK